MATWGRRCPSVGCHEARRSACPLLVSIASGRAGLDYISEARTSFSTKGQQYAFGETDDDGRKAIESFAARHQSVISFIPVEGRVYFARHDD